MFAEVLEEFAQRSDDPRLAPIAARLTAPLRVAVLGRAGVGRGTVARAVAGIGRRIVEADAEVALVVVAETVKPEDAAELARCRAAGIPAVLVANKADVGGGIGVRAPGVPVVACVALLADVALNDHQVAALRALPDAGGDAEATLWQTLDRYGTGLCADALSRGEDPAELPAMLRVASRIDDVLAALDVAAAPLRYGRVRAALTDLRALAGIPGEAGGAVADFLAGDEAVLAVMTAAVDVLQGAGLAVDRADSAAAHLQRAVRWRSYGRRAPVNALHRSCATDVCRGSLRLLGRRR